MRQVILTDQAIKLLEDCVLLAHQARARYAADEHADEQTIRDLTALAARAATAAAFIGAVHDVA